MTAKEFVKTHHPKARAEKQTKTGYGYSYSYWVIRDGNAYMDMAEGYTESKAWVNAKKMIQERLNKSV